LSHLPTDLAVISVTWNTRDLILNALRTLYADLAASGLNASVWVVDNQSTDGTPQAIREQFPQTHVIEAGANLGFAAGNNVAMRALGYSDQPSPAPDAPLAVWLLNPDTLVQPGAIRAMVDALFRLPKAGMVSARLYYEDGSFQHSAFRFPGLWQLLIDLFPLPPRLYARLSDTSLNGRYPRRLYEGTVPFPIDHPLGACMLLRKEVIEQVGLFDEQFFMYCEEVDWSLRIRKDGWEIYTIPTSKIYHLEGRSAIQVKPRTLLNLWTSRLQLYRKHYSVWKRHAADWLIRAGMQLKIRRFQRDLQLDAALRAALIDACQRVIDLTYHA
jgi:N-acetylglucosaminyl-diphospho-decaprenol L-rhamnosyltransferase